ncbi:MAG TPA: type VI secretion system baseplate subunit TssF [Polyangia bacterium]|nr:type VI secretion system baseplate subunit TssF [Polyangia bacterium]
MTANYQKYYLAELAFLREMGHEFAAAYPEVGHMLAEQGSDPDVERLLEGVAFLTAQVRQKLDDEFPEIVYSLTDLIFPEYLRPIPASSILQFTPLPNLLRDRQRIPRGTEVGSVPVEGTPCRFRTTQDVDVLPLTLEQVAVELPQATGAELRLSFKLQSGAKLGTVDLRELRLHLMPGAQAGTATALYLWLCRRARGVVLRKRGSKPGAGGGIRLPPSVLHPAGLGNEEALLPSAPNALGGYRVLQEFYTLPAKFLSVRVSGLERLSELGPETGFDLVIELTEPLPGSLRLTPENLALYCTPVINVFAHDADPIALEHDQTEYRVRPAGPDARHYAVYSVERVSGWVQGWSEKRNYEPLLSFRRGVESGAGAYYTKRLKPAVVGSGSELYVSFSLPVARDTTLPAEVITIELLCSNRRLPTQLRVGDISVPTAATPPIVTFKNLTTPTLPVEPPLGGDLHWRLLAHLNLSYRTLADAEALRDVLHLYNFQALVDRQAARANQIRLQGIKRWQTHPTDRLLRGAAIRGVRFEAELDEDAFADEGELYLFAALLNEVLAAQTSLNTFTELVVTAAQARNRYEFAPRSGHVAIGGIR